MTRCDGVGRQQGPGCSLGRKAISDRKRVSSWEADLIRRRPEWFRSRFAGSVLQLSAGGWKQPVVMCVDRETGEVYRRGHKRGRVQDLSRRSQSRALRTCAAIPWREYGEWVFITLTYPGRGHKCPTPGEARRSFSVWSKRMRRWCGELVGFWHREYQERGYPHYHVLLRNRHVLDVAQWREVVFAAWAAAIGADSRGCGYGAFLRHGVDVVAASDDYDPGSYVAKHQGEWKSHQSKRPVGVESPGRWWGLWGLKVLWTEVELTERQYIRLRRLVRKFVFRACRRRLKTHYGFQGVWSRFRAPGRVLQGIVEPARDGFHVVISRRGAL